VFYWTFTLQANHERTLFFQFDLEFICLQMKIILVLLVIKFVIFCIYLCVPDMNISVGTTEHLYISSQS